MRLSVVFALIIVPALAAAQTELVQAGANASGIVGVARESLPASPKPAARKVYLAEIESINEFVMVKGQRFIELTYWLPCWNRHLATIHEQMPFRGGEVPGRGPSIAVGVLLEDLGFHCRGATVPVKVRFPSPISTGHLELVLIGK